MNLFGICCILAILLTLMLFGTRNNIFKRCGGSFKNESGILMPQVPDVKSGADESVRTKAFWAYKILYQGVIPYLIIGVAILSLLYIMFLIKFRLIPSWWRAQKDIRILDKQILTKKDSQGYESLLKMLESTKIEKRGRLRARLEELEPIYQRFKKQEPVRDANDRLSATDEAGVAYCLQPLNYAIWVLPILGFIGTVLGVTGAIDGLRNGINTLFAQVGLTPEIRLDFMDGFKGLALAFDTTLFGLIGLAVVGTIQFFLKKSASFVILTIDKKVNEAITLLRERDPLEEILKHFFVTNKEGELELGQDEKPVLRWQEWMDLLTRGLFKTDKNGEPVEGDDKQPVARMQDFIEKGFFVTDNDGRLIAGDDALPILRFQKFIESGLFASDGDGQIAVDSLGKPVLRWQQWMDLILDDLFFNYKNQNEDHIHVSKTEQYRRQIVQILIRVFYEVTEDKAEEIAQGYIDGRDEPVPLQSQFERRHRQTYSLLASTAFLVEKSTAGLEKIEEMIEEAVTGESDNNTTARKNRSHWGVQVLQSSNTLIETIALDDRHFVVSREVEGSMGEYELVTGVFQLSPGGRHIQPVAGDSFMPPEKVTGITIQGGKFICACDGSRSIVSYDFTGDGLPNDIGVLNAGTFYPNAISVMSHDEMTQVVVVTEEKGSAKLLVLPIDGSAPSPSTPSHKF